MTMTFGFRSSGSFPTAAAVGVAAAATLVALYAELRRRRHKNVDFQCPNGVVSLQDELISALTQNDEGTTPCQEEEFQTAVAFVNGAGGSLSNTTKLSLYGCYKQAMVGDCDTKRPWGMEASMKWDAWSRNHGASQADMKRLYVATLGAAVPSWRSGEAGAEVDDETPDRGGPSTGPCVSTLGFLGDEAQNADVDESAVGMLNELVARGEISSVRTALLGNPVLAFAADKDGMTPLHWAADRGESDVTLALIAMAGDGDEAVAHMNVRDHDGNTALDYAVLTENQEVARLLVMNGADPYAENHDGETPHAIAEADGWGHLLLMPLP